MPFLFVAYVIPDSYKISFHGAYLVFVPAHISYFTLKPLARTSFSLFLGLPEKVFLFL